MKQVSNLADDAQRLRGHYRHGADIQRPSSPLSYPCPARRAFGGLTRRLTLSRICLLWAAEMQKRTLDSMMGVAGKPTTTTPMFLFNISLPKALAGPTRGDTRGNIQSSEAGSEAARSTITKPRTSAAASDRWTLVPDRQRPPQTPEIKPSVFHRGRSGLTLSWQACRASWV